jgi:general secretion pathway protein M
VLVAYLAGVHWWFTARHLEIANQMGELRERELRFRRTVAQRGEIEQRLAAVRAYEASNPAFLAEGDFDSAAAGLSQRLKQIVQAHARDAQSCQIIMNQYQRPTDKELFERAAIRVRLRCSLEEFGPILHDLEGGSPMLLIDEVQVWKQTGYRAPGSNQVASYLDIQFTLSGYLRKPGAPPKAAT